MTNIKKAIALITALVLCIPLASCSFIKDKIYTVALITGTNGVTNHSSAQGAYEGIEAYCTENNILYKYYEPEEDTEEAIKVQVDEAVSHGAELIVFANYYMADYVDYTLRNYSSVNILTVDCTPEISNSRISSIEFSEEIAAFLAGYAAVTEGFTYFGFIGSEETPQAERYFSGFVQGIDYACACYSVPSPTINRWYTGCITPDSYIKDVATQWYSEGTQVIMVYGEGIYKSVASAANIMKCRMIGCDLDQAGISERFIISAVKNISGAVYKTLGDYFASSGWDSAYAGRTQTYGLDGDYVYLPTSAGSFRFTKWTVESYNSMYFMLESGTLGVNISPSLPATTYCMIADTEYGIPEESSEEASDISSESESSN